MYLNLIAVILNKIIFQADMCIQKAVNVYRECCQVPSVSSGRICPSARQENGSAASEDISIVSHWSQRDIERNEIRKFQRTHLVAYDKSSKIVGDVKEPSFPVELQNM